MGRARWILALAALAALLLLALHGRERSSPPAGVLPTAPGVLRSPAAEELIAAGALEPPLAAPGEGAREDLASETGAERRLGPPNPEESAGEVRELSGRVTVLDPEGNPLGRTGGTLSMNFAGGGHFVRREVKFEGDAWREVFEVHPGWSRLTIVAATVRGGPARLLEPREGFSSPFEGDLDLVLRLRPPAILRVVDAESGRELDGVCVAAARDWRSQGGSSSLLVSSLLVAGPDFKGEHEPSPIALDGRFNNVSSFAVGAPGYAWQRVRFDFTAGGTRTVFLSRGAGLTIEVICQDVDPQPFLTLYGTGDPSPLILVGSARSLLSELAGVRPEMIPLWRGRIGPGSFEFVGMQPESYRATIESHGGDFPTNLFAEEKLELVAGRHARLRLACSPLPVLATAPAAGILRVPAAWEVERLYVGLVPIDSRGDMRGPSVRVQARPTRAGGQDFAWLVEGLAVGEHLLELLAPPFSVQFELPLGGHDGFFHELPPPCDLCVRVLDAAGEAQRTPALSWLPLGGMVPGLQISWDADWDAEQSCWRIRAPVGSIRLSLRSAEHFIDQELDLQGGSQEHEILLRPSSGIRLRLLEGVAPIELPHALDIRLHGPGGLGEHVLPGSDAFERRILVDQPGTYRLEVPKLPGYHQPAPRMLEIEEGRIGECVIELERELP